MYKLLGNLRVVEASSFVASPSAGLYLSQFGAEVIRIDQIGGGPDFNRWPLGENGKSLYWESLNKGKKSVALNLGNPEGRELMAQLATAPGENAGILLTNYPVDGFLSHEKLSQRRQDLITVRVMGLANGGPALDYTVNSALGIPFMTGPQSMGDAPVNHVLAAWDLLVGAYSSFSILAALIHRNATKMGQEVRIPLSDMGIASVANMGMIGEVLLSGENRPRYGNDLYGAFGRDFATKDNKHLMVVAISERQWSGLLKSLNIESQIAQIENENGVSFKKDEGIRFEYRDAINPLIENALKQVTATEIAPIFDANGVCWGPYKTMLEAAQDKELVTENPIFTEIMNPSGYKYPQAGSPATIPGLDRGAPIAAPKLGQDTEWAMAELLKLPQNEIARLMDAKIIAGA